MAVWVLRRALDGRDRLCGMRRAGLVARLDISREEIARWVDVIRRMYVPFHGDGIISQVEGYENLLDFDWDAYRARHGNTQCLGLILKAENDSPQPLQTSKQSDVLMLFYLFSSEELGGLFARIDYPFEYETIPKNIDYYADTSSHGSTLCRGVYAWVLARSHRHRAMDFFAEALQSDVSDIRRGTTSEGIHPGAMAGTVDLVQRVATGLEVKGDVLRIKPRLPEELKRLDPRIRSHIHLIGLRPTRDTLTVRGHDTQGLRRSNSG